MIHHHPMAARGRRALSWRPGLLALAAGLCLGSAQASESGVPSAAEPRTASGASDAPDAPVLLSLSHWMQPEWAPLSVEPTVPPEYKPPPWPHTLAVEDALAPPGPQAQPTPEALPLPQGRPDPQAASASGSLPPPEPMAMAAPPGPVVSTAAVEAPAAQVVAQAVLPQQRFAVAGQVADVGSTGVGLLLGAAEANPLGLLTLGAKALMYQNIQKAPAEQQPRLWKLFGAFGWAATANNVCVITALLSGGLTAGLCPLIGVAAGLGAYKVD